MPLSFPKIVSLSYAIILVGSFASIGWLENPIAFYGEFYNPVFFQIPIPKSSVTALEHMSIVLAQRE